VPWNSYFDAPLLTALLNGEGIPIVDRPTLLGSGSIPCAGGVPVSLGVFHVASFHSIIAVITGNEPATNTAPPATHYGEIVFYHLENDTDPFDQAVDWDSNLFYGDNNITAVDVNSRFNSGARAAWLGVTVTWFDIAPVNVTGAIYGSYRPVDNVRVFNGHGYWGASGIGSVTGRGVDGLLEWSVPALAANGDAREYPNTLAGPATITFRNNIATPSTYDYFILDPQSGAVIGGKTLATGFVGPDITSINMPARPVIINAHNHSGTTGAGAATISITQSVR